MPPYCLRLEKSSGFLPSRSIPTRPSFLSCHNWRQISGVLDGQMALYGITDWRPREDEARAGCVICYARSRVAEGEDEDAGPAKFHEDLLGDGAGGNAVSRGALGAGASARRGENYKRNDRKRRGHSGCADRR